MFVLSDLHAFGLHLGRRGWLAVLPVGIQGTVTTECLAGHMQTMLKELVPCQQRSCVSLKLACQLLTSVKLTYLQWTDNVPSCHQQGTGAAPKV